MCGQSIVGASGMFLNYAKFHSNQEIASTYYDRHYQNVGTLLLI